MAIIRDPAKYDNTVNYVATLALFCAISCVVLMLRFKGFKATINLSSPKKKNQYQTETEISLNGAYRTHRDEFFGNGRLSDPPKKITASMVKLPPSAQSQQAVKPSKSTSDLTNPNNLQPNLSKSTPDVSFDPRGGATNNRNSTDLHRNKQNEKDVKNREKERKRLEKQQLAEHKKREKLAAQEQAKQDKIRKEREKLLAQQQARELKKKEKPKEKKKAPPAPKPQQINPLAQASMSYSTNTLESSISKSSGPPPYSEIPKIEKIVNKNDNTGNTSFGKPIENSNSWDLISQHRQQINRPKSKEAGRSKQTVMDLKYNFGNPQVTSGNEDRDNSEA